jgi:GNAT superfamily N-acetyltransferase
VASEPPTPTPSGGEGEGSSYAIAEVGPDDLGDLARLRTDWTVAMGAVPAEADTRGFDSRLRDWWERQAGTRHAWLVRDEDDEAVGMANVQVFERMPRPGVPDSRWAYVANVWVDQSHRRGGLGTELMTYLVEWCRAEGMERIVLNPSDMSQGSYASLGFRPADDLLRLDL